MRIGQEDWYFDWSEPPRRAEWTDSSTPRDFGSVSYSLGGTAVASAPAPP